MVPDLTLEAARPMAPLHVNSDDTEEVAAPARLRRIEMITRRPPVRSRQKATRHGDRALSFLTGFGWVPVDPADVRKVVLEEPPGNLALTDQKVAAARRALLGSWEGNWLAYNVAHDLVLPGAKGPKLGFLMYPQAETVSGRLDCLDPDTFRYTITAREVSA
jgi:transglutaminase-like putative cysteine protease